MGDAPVIERNRLLCYNKSEVIALTEMIKRINELAKKKREQGLTDEEQKEQKELYKKYLANFRNNMEKQLDNTDVEYPDGKVVPFKEAAKRNGNE